jgi:RNA polymerase sigma-70 factor (family 1)
MSNHPHWAFKDVYSLCYPPLCYYAGLLLNNKQEAEDVVTESFMKLLDRQGNFDDMLKIKSFLFKCTRNACLNILKHSQRNGLMLNEMNIRHEKHERSVDDEMIRLEVLDEIYCEIEHLPQRCREIFKLIFLEGLSNKEIAERAHINVQTVRSQKAKALELVRTRFFARRLENGRE